MTQRLLCMFGFGIIALLLSLSLSALPAAADDGEGDWQDAGQVGEDAGAAPDEAVPADALPPDGKAPTCVVTGLPWLDSSTRVEAIFKVDGQRLRGKFLSVLYMLIQYKLLKEDGKSVALETVSVLDFATFGTDHERMIPVNEDWSNIVFISTDSPLKGSKDPYYAAFSTVEDIEAAKKSLSGKVLSYESVMKRLLNALNTDEDSEQVVEDETASMRRQFKDFNPMTEE